MSVAHNTRKRIVAMTDEDKLAAIALAGLTDDQLNDLADGRVGLWQSDDIRADERKAILAILDEAFSHPPGMTKSRYEYVVGAIRARAALLLLLND